MWLINCRTYRLEANDVDGPTSRPYLILSHTWGNEEVTFGDMANLRAARKKKGFAKIRGICDIALSTGYSYAWVDTCCIDKSSSAELTESINSMYHWYKSAASCIVCLEDLTPGLDVPTVEQLSRCRWFTRGWTLQELIAPAVVEFYDGQWNHRGTKIELCHALHLITGVDENTLLNPSLVHDVPVARRFAWAADRHTSRPEDQAYCLLGIFDVNMPLIYGERHRAFLRLQEVIAQKNNDLSLFAWRAQDQSYPNHYGGLIAQSPAQFRGCTNLERTYDPVMPSPSWALTNAGIEITTALDYSEGTSGYRMLLHCIDRQALQSGAVNNGDIPLLCIWLRKTRSGFVRYLPSEVCSIPLSAMRFEEPALIRIATSISHKQLGDAFDSYPLLSGVRDGYSVLGVQYQILAPGLRDVAVGFHPSHLWDHQQKCFFTSAHQNFIALVEVKLLVASEQAMMERTCWVFVGLATPGNGGGGGGRPQPWVEAIPEGWDGRIPGPDNYERRDLLNPFTLSSIGFRFRERLERDPLAFRFLSKPCVVECAPAVRLEVAASTVQEKTPYGNRWMVHILGRQL